MTTYTAPAGKRIAGGREIYPHAVLDLIAAASDGAWVLLNTNNFSAAWPPIELRESGTEKIISAWPSVAWDAKRHRIYAWGGGHANYTGNEMYYWDAFTRQWHLAYHGVKFIETGVGSTITAEVGDMLSPVASHTYDNQTYLRKLDRFLTWGGAAAGDGGWFKLHGPGLEVLRTIPGYMCQLDLAGQGFVGGPTGANRRGGAWASVAIPGAKPWAPLLYDGVSAISGGTINGVGEAVVLNDVDVVFQAFRSGTSRFLTRITMPSTDISTHTAVQVGGTAGSSSYGGGCFVSSRDIFIMTGRSDTSVALQFWADVSTRSNSGAVQNVLFANMTGDGKSYLESQAAAIGRVVYGVAYDPVRDRIIAWNDDATPLIELVPPSGSPVSASGWQANVVSGGATPAVHDYSGRVCGKWLFAPELDCFIGIHDRDFGRVYAWKPHGWIDPRASQ